MNEQPAKAVNPPHLTDEELERRHRPAVIVPTIGGSPRLLTEAEVKAYCDDGNTFDSLLPSIEYRWFLVTVDGHEVKAGATSKVDLEKVLQAAFPSGKVRKTHTDQALRLIKGKKRVPNWKDRQRLAEAAGNKPRR